LGEGDIRFLVPTALFSNGVPLFFGLESESFRKKHYKRVLKGIFTQRDLIQAILLNDMAETIDKFIKGAGVAQGPISVGTYLDRLSRVGELISFSYPKAWTQSMSNVLSQWSGALDKKLKIYKVGKTFTQNALDGVLKLFILHVIEQGMVLDRIDAMRIFLGETELCQRDPAFRAALAEAEKEVIDEWGSIVDAAAATLEGVMAGVKSLGSLGLDIGVPWIIKSLATAAGYSALPTALILLAYEIFAGYVKKDLIEATENGATLAILGTILHDPVWSKNGIPLQDGQHYHFHQLDFTNLQTRNLWLNRQSLFYVVWHIAEIAAKTALLEDKSFVTKWLQKLGEIPSGGGTVRQAFSDSFKMYALTTKGIYKKISQAIDGACASQNSLCSVVNGGCDARTGVGKGCASACSTEHCAVEGQKGCDGKKLKVCRRQQQGGCLAWETEDCPIDFECKLDHCVSTGSSCIPECLMGTSDCNANTPRLCQKDAKGCPQWQDQIPCATGKVCQSGVCIDKPSLPQIIDFKAIPSKIAQGQSALMSWNVVGADKVHITDVGAVGLSGNLSLKPATTTTYTLTALNAAGKVTKDAKVEVSTVAGLSITHTEVSPSSGIVSPQGQPVGTTFTWTMRTFGGQNTICPPNLTLKNPKGGNFSFPMSATSGTSPGAVTFTYAKTLQDVGIYEYQFHAFVPSKTRDCSSSPAEEAFSPPKDAQGNQAWFSGPVVTAVNCQNACSQEGMTDCVSSSAYKLCTRLSNGCLGWSGAVACALGEICISGKCGQVPQCPTSCSSDSDCAACPADQKSCISGKCGQAPQCPTSCSSDSDCAACPADQKSCISGKCGQAPQCPMSCSSDSDCAACPADQKSCISGKCGQAPQCPTSCSSDSDCAACPAGQRSCVSGKCASPSIFPSEVIISAGSFTMGSPSSELGRNSYEGPQRTVELTRSFAMWKYEVTQGEFQALMGYNPSGFSSCGANCPVEEVNWYEAAAFCNVMSKSKGLAECFDCTGSGTSVSCTVKSQYSGQNYYNCKGYRLPTEAEWEYAYRAGTSTAFYNGDITKTDCGLDPNLDKIGWYCGNASKTQPVGGKQANAWGLHDMAGNVYEWVYDWYQDSYSGLSGKDPVGPSTSSVRVRRGGGYDYYAQHCRAADRYGVSPGDRHRYLGFRFLRSL
jgi:formylglycine-generating enzyme required for sulfatase activity